MPSDMNALQALIEQIEPGWTVDVTDYDYGAHSGRRTITRTYTMADQTYRHEGRTHVARKGGPAYNSKGPNGREYYYQFPVEGDDFEVDGLTLRIFNPSHAYVGGRRAITHEFRYSPPSA